MQELQFDYYRGMEAEQYTFYRIPKVLFTANVMNLRGKRYDRRLKMQNCG